MMRVAFKTDALNTQSRRAIARLGAVEEGTFRKHLIAASGWARDMVFFSILDTEWPAVEATLRDRLARANVDSSPQGIVPRVPLIDLSDERIADELHRGPQLRRGRVPRRRGRATVHVSHGRRTFGTVAHTACCFMLRR